MFKIYTSYCLVISGITHTLCCGIPLLLSVNSLLFNQIFTESIPVGLRFLETVETYLFAFTTVLFLMLISFEIYNKKINNIQNEVCCPEDKSYYTKKTVRFNIILSSVLYLLNSAFFLSENITL